MTKTTNTRLKFQVGDTVFDTVTNIFGKISGYIGNSYYSLEDLYFPIYQQNNISKLKLLIKVNIIDTFITFSGLTRVPPISNTYIQASRLLMKVDEFSDIETIIIDPSHSYFLFDKSYNTVLEVVGLNITGSRMVGRDPLNYAKTFVVKTSWKIKGNFFTDRINSITKESFTYQNIEGNAAVGPAGRAWHVGLTPIQDITPESLEKLFNWETEFAPFIIGGVLV